jgi:hypothetical protein
MSTVELMTQETDSFETLIYIFDQLKISYTQRAVTPQVVLFEISEFDYKKHLSLLSTFLNEQVE